MKIVKMLTSLANWNYSYDHGALVSLEDHIADDWVKSGLASFVDPDPQVPSEKQTKGQKNG